MCGRARESGPEKEDKHVLIGIVSPPHKRHVCEKRNAPTLESASI
jgi:hypothetical protein